MTGSSAVTHFKPKSNFCPNVSNHSINTFCRIVEHEVLKVNEQPFRVSSNLSQREKKALTMLLDDKDLVLKPADKGGGIVVQDMQKYRLEILSQLSDVKFYKPLKNDPTLSFQREILIFFGKC